MDRQPAVAGRFYPDDPRRLRALLDEYCAQALEPEPALAVVVPHAGYVYSGATAGKVYARVRVPSSAIVIGPNHTGLGPTLSLMDRGRWIMPLGPVDIDESLAARIRQRVPHVVADQLAHLREHAVEVHVPFLQHQCADVRIVPMVAAVKTVDACREIGEALADIVAEQPAQDRPLLVASTDMSHYVAAANAQRLDHIALERVLALDPEGLLRVVRDNDISMCGVIPTTIVLFAALRLGATQAELVEYTHSGVTSGDFEHVVGYAGLVIK